MPKADEFGNHDHEAPGQRHLLGQPRPLGPDRVLRHLAEDGLTGPQHLLDPGPPCPTAARLDVVAVVADVTPVEHGVLRGADVHEGRFHPRQDVLDPAPVDVPVDLGGVVGRPRHLVFDQGPALEHGDLGGVGPHMDTHEVPPHRPSPPLPPAAAPGPAPGRLGPSSSSSSTDPPTAARRRPARWPRGLRPSPAPAVVAGRPLVPHPPPWPPPGSGAAPGARPAWGRPGVTAAGAGRVSPIRGRSAPAAVGAVSSGDGAPSSAPTTVGFSGVLLGLRPVGAGTGAATPTAGGGGDGGSDPSPAHPAERRAIPPRSRRVDPPPGPSGTAQTADRSPLVGVPGPRLGRGGAAGAGLGAGGRRGSRGIGHAGAVCWCRPRRRAHRLRHRLSRRSHRT